jgi:hypothetical protein
VAFLNASMMIGGLLIAVPFLIHLAMRRKPTVELFPALRFVRKKQVTNKRTLRFKQWLLLLLRSLLLAILVFALAGPSADRLVAGNWVIIGTVSLLILLVAVVLIAAVAEQVSRSMVVLITIVLLLLTGFDGLFVYSTLTNDESVLVGDEDAAVAAVLIFDNSPRMGYQQNDQTRLAAGQFIGDWLVRQLPNDSQIAVIDLAAPPHVFSQDINSAVHAIEQLQITYTPELLQTAIRSALELISTSELTRHEVYLFTDLAKSAWETIPESLSVALRAADVELFLVDVGLEQPDNVALGIAKLSGAVLTQHGSIDLIVNVQSIGHATQRTVTLKLENPDPTLPVITDGELQTPTTTKLAEQVVVFPAADVPTAQVLSFSLSGLAPGEHHGSLTLTGVDGLAIDDVRYFTVSVRPAWNILVVAPPDVPTRFFTEAIAPASERQMGHSPYRVKIVRNHNLISEELAAYTGVVFIDPAPLPKDLQQQLSEYVASGGSLGLFLGHNMELSAANAHADLIGGTLTRQWRADTGNFLEIRDGQHRSLRSFQTMPSSVPWAQFPIMRYWHLENLGVQTQTVMQFSQTRHPALTQRNHGKGIVLTLLTPISEPAQIAGRTSWNELVSGDDNWPYFLLINGIAETLVSTGESRFNYLAGETVHISNSTTTYPDRYQLFTPDADVQDTRVLAETIQIPFTQRPGAYRLKGIQDGPIVRGFSVNVPEQYSDLERLTPVALQRHLNGIDFQVARSRHEIEFGVRQRRVGQEFYPLLLILFATVFFLEHLMCNRFYGQQQATPPIEIQPEI